MTGGGGQTFSFSIGGDISNAAQALTQLEQHINRVGAAALRSLNIRFDIINKQTAAQDIQEVERNVNAMRTRLRANNIDIPIRVNFREAEKDVLNFKNLAEGSLRGLFRGSGFGGGVPVGLGFGAGAAGIVAAGQATEALTRALVGGFQAGIQYNSMLEQSTLQISRYTGSAQAAGKVIEQLTKYADATPFGTEETIQVGTQLIRVADGNIERMQKLLELTGALAVTNPYQGLEGASYAIRELISGDTQSFADRFNTSRALLQQLRREASTTDEFIKLAVAAAGGSTAQIEGLSQTFQGRLSTIQSFVAQLGQRFTAGFFAQLSEAAGEATKGIEEHGNQWRDTAQGIGVAAAAIVGYIGNIVKEIAKMTGGLINLPDFETMGREARERVAAEDRQRVPVQQLPEYDAAAKSLEHFRDLAKDANVALGDVDLTLKQNAASLQRVNNEAAAIKNEYLQQLRPLERQLELLARPEWDRARRVAQLDIGIAGAESAALRAGPSPATQGDVARRQSEIESAKQLVEIENRRQEIAEQFVEAANRGKSALERQAEAQQNFVRALQEEHQQVQDVRQRRLEGFREEIEAAQEARRERLDGLREENRAIQENRREAIDAMREQQRVAAEGRRDELDRIREVYRQESEGIQDAEREFERSHRARTQAYQEQIDQLRQRLDAEKQQGPSAAEQQLAGLDKQEREVQRKQSLADAVRAVREADTIKERLDARRRLQELQHEQDVAKKREALQEQIEREREAREQRREAIQNQINALERKAREDDRTYQSQREARQEAAEQQSRANADAERQAETAAKLQDRQDAASLREAERNAKEADRNEARALREEEKSERDKTNAEQASIRAEERANREADRIEQQTIRAEQARERELSEAASAAREAQTEARQRAADERAARLAPLELAKLEQEERLLHETDTQGKARAEGEKVRLEATKAIEVAEGNIFKANQDYKALGIKQEVEAIKDAEYDRLLFVTQQKEQIELARGLMQEQKAILVAQKDEYDLIIGRLNLLQAKLRGDETDDAGNIVKKGAQQASGEPERPIQTSGLLKAAAGFVLGPEEGAAAVKSYEDLANDIVLGFGNRLRAEVTGLSHILPDGMVAGLVAYLDADQDGEISVVEWGRGILNAILGFFGISSPSTVMRDIFAKGLIDGAVLGIQDGQQAVVDAIIGVFGKIGEIAAGAIVGENGLVTIFRNGLAQMNIDLTTVGPQITENLIKPFVTADVGGKALQMKNDVTTAWNNLSTDLSSAVPNILTQLKAPFEGILQYLPSLPPAFQTSGTNNSTSWINGWFTQNPAQAVANTFNGLFTGFFNTLNQSFNNSGINAAVSWINGYVQQFNNFIQGGARQAMQGVQNAVSGGQQIAQNVGNAISSAPSVLQIGNLPPLISRDGGGAVWPGSMYKIRMDEGIAQFGKPGQVFNSDMLQRMGNGSVDGGQRANVSVTVANGAVQVQTNGGVNERALGERLGKQIVRAVYSALDEAERFAPDPVSRTLGGAD